MRRSATSRRRPDTASSISGIRCVRLTSASSGHQKARIVPERVSAAHAQDRWAERGAPGLPGDGGEMPFCNACGSEFEVAPRFCPDCGQRQDQTTGPESAGNRTASARPQVVESDAIVAPGSGLRTWAIVFAVLTILWAVGYVLAVDRTFSGFLVSLVLQPFAWAALAFGFTGDRRAEQYARCQHCGAPVPGSATVCLKCGRDLDVLLITAYRASFPIVIVLLITAAAIAYGLVQSGAASA